MRICLIFATATLAAGCADVDSEPSSNEGAEIVQSPLLIDNAAPPTPAATADECGAADHQWLVGENRSRIPEEPEGATWRITCTTCPVTQDYSPQRMNIFYDQETEIVETVSCG